MDNNQNNNYYDDQAYQNQNYNYDYNQPQQQPNAQPPTGAAIKAMVFGILSILLGSIPGIIFAVIAKKTAAPILLDWPGTQAYTFAKVGKITGTVGFWLSLVSTIILALYIVFLIFYVFIVVLLLGSL